METTLWGWCISISQVGNWWLGSKLLKVTEPVSGRHTPKEYRSRVSALTTTPLLQGHAITLLQLLLNTLAPNVVSLGMMPRGGSGDAENLLINHIGSTSEAVTVEWVWALRPTPRPCHSPTLWSPSGRLNRRSCCSQGPSRSPSVYPWGILPQFPGAGDKSCVQVPEKPGPWPEVCASEQSPLNRGEEIFCARKYPVTGANLRWKEHLHRRQGPPLREAHWRFRKRGVLERGAPGPTLPITYLKQPWQRRM